MIQSQFFNWSSSGLDWNVAPYEACSPNLNQLLQYLIERWGGYSLGCHNDRSIRDGVAMSAHAYGAALDWRYTPVPADAKNVTRQTVEQNLLPWLIANSGELHLDAIHDYYGDRIWRAGRTSNVADAYGAWWKKQYGAGSGMGESWATYLHLETHRQGFTDGSPIAGRFGTPLIYEAPPYLPTDLCFICPPDAERTRWLQTICNQWFGATLVVDGSFGAKTEAAVRVMQSQLGVSVDGRYGRITATALDAWLEARKP